MVCREYPQLFSRTVPPTLRSIGSLNSNQGGLPIGSVCVVHGVVGCLRQGNRCSYGYSTHLLRVTVASMECNGIEGFC